MALPDLLSKGLEILADPEKGQNQRRVVTISPRVVGDTILTEECKGFVVLPGHPACEFCLKSAENRCSVCKQARYCSPACQVKLQPFRSRQKHHWPRHKLECKLPRKSVDVFLLARVDPKDLAHLLVPALTPEADSELTAKATLAEPLFKIPVGELKRRLSILRSNCFTIGNEELIDQAIGLFPTAALFNHSCQPNLVPLWEGTRVTLRALVDIEAGSELTLPYLEYYASTEMRRKQLQENFFFHCTCPRCLAPDPLACYTGNEKALELARAAPLNTLQELRAALDLWAQAADKANAERVNLLRKLELKAVEQQDWPQALFAVRSLVEVTEKFCPVGWPTLSLSYLTLFKLELLAGRPEVVVQLAPRAYRSLKISHGSGHGLTRLVSELTQTANQDIAWAAQDPRSYARQRALDAKGT